jgi:hypothetical protein
MAYRSQRGDPGNRPLPFGHPGVGPAAGGIRAARRAIARRMLRGRVAMTQALPGAPSRGGSRWEWSSCSRRSPCPRTGSLPNPLRALLAARRFKNSSTCFDSTSDKASSGNMAAGPLPKRPPFPCVSGSGESRTVVPRRNLVPIPAKPRDPHRTTSDQGPDSRSARQCAVEESWPVERSRQR